MKYTRQHYFLFKTSLIGAVLCVSASSIACAKTALSDQILENAVRMKGAFNQEALIQAAADSVKSQSEQQQELSQRINSNSQKIQENSLDGSEMSQYLTQKKRPGQNTIAVDGVKRLNMTHVVHHITEEHYTITYPDGLVVEMKPYK